MLQRNLKSAVGSEQEQEKRFATSQLSTVRRFAMVEYLSVGMKLHAMYANGEFYPGEVVSLSTSAKRNPAPWTKKIDLMDMFVSLSDIK